MAITEQQSNFIKAFYKSKEFSKSGGYIIDLDGTIALEKDESLVIDDKVEEGLIEVCKYKSPFVINSLRSPKSIIDKLASQLFAITNNPIPMVLLNGSFIGILNKTQSNKFYYKDVETLPMTKSEIESVVCLIKYYFNQSVCKVHIVCYYTDWKIDEKKIVITKCNIDGDLRVELLKHSINMIYIECKKLDGNKVSKNITHNKVDKLSGARRMALKLQVCLSNCLGAGNSLQDNYLSEVGMAVHINNINYEDSKRNNSIHLKSISEFGELLIYMNNII